MNNLDITYCCVENVITIKNNSDSFTGVLWFSITDCETNLNVTCWWMDLAPYESQTWNLPLNYYEVVKEFDINVMDEQFNLLFKKNTQLKKINSRLNFKPKNKMEVTYGSWESLVYRNEYDIKIKEDDIVYDLGGNVGVFSKWCLIKNVNYIYLFEPDVRCIENMKDLFEEDKNKITLINKVILDEDKRINFYLHQHSIANTLFLKSNECLEIDSINLEKYINENNLKKPTLLKCDIEGAEYKFINSVSDSFFNTIRIFILEFHFLDVSHKDEMYKIINRFLSIGYTVRLSNISKFENDVGTLFFEKL
jgi:hypothetical protein